MHSQEQLQDLYFALGYLYKIAHRTVSQISLKQPNSPGLSIKSLDGNDSAPLHVLLTARRIMTDRE